MVADAKALETGVNPRKTETARSFEKEQQSFRGSWSGYERDKMFVKPDGGYPRFFDAAYVLGLDLDDDGRASTPVDIDGDGDLDLVVLSLQGLHLFENTSAPRRFARVRLVATKSEPLALGARIRVTAAGCTQQGWVKLTEGFLTQIPRELHFGLADAASIDRIEVDWPSGKTEAWTNLPSDRLIELREASPKAEVTVLNRWPEETRPKLAPAFSLGLSVNRVEGGPAKLGLPGKPVVINFWAPWCAPCKQELPELAALASACGADVQFAGVSLETKDLDSLRATVVSLGVPYPQFVADDAVIRSFFGPEGKTVLPATFVLDATGRLRRAFLRPVTRLEIATVLDSFQDHGSFAHDIERRGLDALLRFNFEGALGDLRKASAMRPEDSHAHYLLGLCLLGLRKHEEALVEFQACVRLDPEFVAAAHFNIGTLLRKFGRPAEAIKPLQDALRIGGEQAEVLKALGAAFGESGKPAEGVECFDKALLKFPQDAESLSAKGRLLLVMRSFANARKAFELALAIEPRNAESWIGKGQAVYMEGHPEEGIACVKKALELDPKNAWAKSVLADMQR